MVDVTDGKVAVEVVEMTVVVDEVVVVVVVVDVDVTVEVSSFGETVGL